MLLEDRMQLLIWYLHYRPRAIRKIGLVLNGKTNQRAAEAFRIYTTFILLHFE